ncbi:flagellar protein FlgN [uncultured Desulfosarcina sp.]|uniref:flagellar protein FlgN n=1 Tax=uncultured Desulfosarcina sp. TaxID=218289 RepID=UPI0029C7C267|nr:flagellar protein FlgN [uncultured Desulfosarcina sp.]
MNAAIDQLISTLNEETECYDEMKAVLQDEARAIPLSNRQELDRARSRKEALVARITRLERKREDSVRQLASTYRIDASMVKVSELVAYLPDPYAGKLKSCAEGLRSLIEEVRLKNGANRQLVRYYMKWIDNAMHLLTGLFDERPIYRKPGIQLENSGYRSNSGNIIRSSI